jgi:hypothetical protein
MVELDWTPSTIMLGHLQKVVKHGFMTVAELKACHVPEDPAFPVPIEGYVVSILGSFNIVGLGTGEMGLSGYPWAPLLPTSWRPVATVCRLMKEMLAMVSRDVLQLARVNRKT